MHLGLSYEDVEYSYSDARHREESAIMNGLERWVCGIGDRPPTWAALLEAMHAVGIEERNVTALEEVLLEGTVCNVKWSTGSLMV